MVQMYPKGDEQMDLTMSIAALSTQMATQQISLDVGTAMLSKSLDMSATVTDSLTKMMEQSVTPYLGGSIDITV